MCAVGGEGGKLLLFTAGPVPGLPASPGALLTGESSSRAGFQAGDHQIQITSAPQLSTEAQVPAGFRAAAAPSFKKSLLSTARARTVVIRRYKTLIYIAGRVIYTLM